MLKSAQSVRSLTDCGHQRLVAENRAYIKTVSAVLRMIAIQLMAQMGHDVSDQSLNQSNFLEILNLVTEHDAIVAKKINGPRNARYTHLTIQSELIGIKAEHIKKDIAREISQAGCFAIMVDETKHCSKSEQLSCKFVFQLVMFEKLLPKFNIVLKQQQSATCELSQAIDLAGCLKHHLADVRSNCKAADGMWSDISKSAENIIRAHDLSMEVRVRRQRA